MPTFNKSSTLINTTIPQNKLFYIMGDDDAKKNTMQSIEKTIATVPKGYSDSEVKSSRCLPIVILRVVPSSSC